MLKYLDFVIPEPYRDGNRTDLTWETFQEFRDSAVISKKFNDYLKGKKVVIVGPSPYLVDQGRGSYIDSFDVVIRMNKGWKIANDRVCDYGSKTSIRWHCMMEHPNNGGDFAIEEMIDHKVEWLASQFPRNLDYFHYDNIGFETKNKNRINFHHFSDLCYFLNIHRALETRPNVAPTAVFELINYDIASLHLMGVTFFKDGWDKSYKQDSDYKKENAVLGHAQESQIHLLKLIHDNEPNFTMDAEIHKLIYHN